jgi:hypothetical protein
MIVKNKFTPKSPTRFFQSLILRLFPHISLSISVSNNIGTKKIKRLSHLLYAPGNIEILPAACFYLECYQSVDKTHKLFLLLSPSLSLPF